MHTGLLWFDNSKLPVPEKIQKAIDYYIKKYNLTPDLCLINPTMFPADCKTSFNVGTVTVRPYRPVLPGHIWVGIEDKN